MQKMREGGGVSSLLTSKLQIYGVLSKRPVGHQSSKWTKRFFVVKDGFLLYYPDSEKKEFEKKKFFNVHPRGAVPLGGCVVETLSEPGHPFTMRVVSEDVNGDILLSAESEYDRERWIDILRQSCRITWNNAQLGEVMIQKLEEQGLQMAQEKQNYFDQLQTEAMALHDEKVKTEELERVKEELEKEKLKMENLALELKEEHSRLKIQLEETLRSMKTVEDDKQSLQSTTQQLQQSLEDLEKEKSLTLSSLSQRESETLKLSQEKQNLSDTTDELRQKLQMIEDQTKKLLDEKAAAEERLCLNEQRALQLEQEKQAINEHAEELQASMKDLVAQKAVTEAELKEEVMARLDAERRLKEAEESLIRLEKTVKGEDMTQGTITEETKEEMIGDVRTLKKFFDNLAFEAKLDADKPVMIKNSIHARKQMVRRAKTMRFEASRKRQSRESMPPMSPYSSLSASSLGMPSFSTMPPMSPSSPLFDFDLPSPLQSPVMLRDAASRDSGAYVPHSVIGLLETSPAEKGDKF